MVNKGAQEENPEATRAVLVAVDPVAGSLLESTGKMIPHWWMVHFSLCFSGAVSLRSQITCKKSQMPGELIANNDSQFLSASLDASVQASRSQVCLCILSQAC